MHRHASTSALIPFSLLLAVPAAASSQDTAADKTREADRPDDIIVTARRTEERLARSPVAVSVLDGESLRERGFFQLPNLQEQFPALAISPTSTGNLVFIRGVGNFTLLPNSDPAAAYAYDGVFIARPAGTTTQSFDLDRVELLKGPQGVLYGRNASAGSINIEPRQPVIGETSAFAHLGVGSSDFRRAEVAANVALGDRSALRLSGLLAKQDHLLAGYADGQNEQALRAQMKTRAGPVSVRLSADYARVTGIGIGTAYLGNYVFSQATGRYGFVDAGLPLSEGLYSNRSQAYRQTIFLPAAGRTLDALSSRPEQDNRFFGVHAQVVADLAVGQLTLIPAWRRSRVDVVAPGPPFGLAQDDDLDQASLEARLLGRRDRFDWIVGTFLFREGIDSISATNLSSSLILTEQSYRTRSAALFGNLTYAVRDGLRLSGGARFTRDRKSFASNSDSFAITCLQRVDNRPSCPTVPLFSLVRSTAGIPFALPTTPGGTRPPIVASGVPTGAVSSWSNRVDAGRLADRAVTWRLGAEADLGPRALFYASVETGYRPGGFNAATGFETFEPERITAYTLGLRQRSRDQRWQMDLEAFWWNYRDQQVSSLRPDLSSPPRNANITANIANSRIRGFEADLRFRPWVRTEMGSVIQYLDSDYRSFRYLQANTNVPPLTGCAATLNPAVNLYEVDCSTLPPYNSPRWSLVLTAAQGVRLGGWTLTGAIDSQFRTSRNIGFAFLPQQRIGATWRTNLRLTASDADRRVAFGLLLRNLEDDRVPDFVISHPVSNAVVAGSSPPFSVGAWLALRL